MAHVTWSFPTRVLFGIGVASETGREGKRLGATRALLVCDKGVVNAGLHEGVAASLTAEGVHTTLFDRVDPNPTERNVREGVEAARGANADLIVALGGGSPLDTAKLIRMQTYPGAHDRPLVDYDDATGGDAFITSNMPPMIALPTTAGTGTEVGRSGVVTLDVNRRKTVIFSPHLLANAALLDPVLTRGLPRAVTAATGFDALTHCVEAYLSRGDHPMADAIALGGLGLVARSLERACNLPADLDARGDMMKAAMMGAVAFQKGLGACHSLAHPLSSECGLHHGLANAECLPAVIEFNGEVVAGRIADLGRALGVATTPAGFADALRSLRATLGLPAGLIAAGVAPSQLDALADKAVIDACHTLNPRPCSRDDLLALYRASL